MEVPELLVKGGPVMYLLLICSVTITAVGIERFRFYRYAVRDSEKFLNQLKICLKAEDIRAGRQLCQSGDSLLSGIALAGIEAFMNGENVELALIDAHDEGAMKLRARLNYLSMIVTLAPLLGLLGTISGMIESFNIFNLRAGQPMAITGGIGEALIATATGLCVAIFALLVHTYFAQKLDEILTTFGKAMNLVMISLTRKSENIASS